MSIRPTLRLSCRPRSSRRAFYILHLRILEKEQTRTCIEEEDDVADPAEVVNREGEKHCGRGDVGRAIVLRLFELDPAYNVNGKYEQAVPECIPGVAVSIIQGTEKGIARTQAWCKESGWRPDRIQASVDAHGTSTMGPRASW
jgi:hypothetical protein